MRSDHELDIRVLRRLSANNMHVRVIDHNNLDPRLSTFPLAHVVISTYFVVRGADVVFVGSRQGLYNFALQEN